MYQTDSIFERLNQVGTLKERDVNMTNIQNKIHEYMDLYTKNWAFSGAIAAIQNGEVVFQNAYGYANIEHKVKNAIETKFRLYSVTKQFTAVAILMLEERGLLKVEDPVRNYFPNWHELDDRITIHHLLNHTSGLVNYTATADFDRMKNEKSDFFKRYVNLPLEFEPGTQFNYCNTGYDLLGMLIEELSGVSYIHFLKENIFLPLAMFNTGLVDNKTIIDGMASGYYLHKNDLVHCKYVDMEKGVADGGLYSTVLDMLKWDQALRSEVLLSKQSVERMETAYKDNYGYGVEINMHGDKKMIHHNGGYEGFLPALYRYVDYNFAVVVLSNYGFAASDKLCMEISKIALEEQYDLPNKPAEYSLSPETLESYLGVYGEAVDTIEIRNEGEGLSVIFDDEVVCPVYPISKNVLHHTWIDESYPISKDENGKLSIWGYMKREEK